jgi:hypothetical protein
MDKSSIAIQSLRARAVEYREHAADCLISRYWELTHKGAAHLYEQAQLREARLPVGSELLLGIRENGLLGP